MKTYFIFSFLFSIVITQSCNTGDRQIQQRCFNLVNQQLSWSEARNYCHNRNSYLATVPEQTTDSYLASYARTSFNINEGNFWIGLYRNSTTSKWQWDDGTPFAWNNFENPNLNYVAESIKNGKWNTFVAETRLNFVCSYYPNGAPTEPVTGSTEPPHWTTTESETVTPTASSACFDNGDKEIGGSCYKLVPQKLTYADAQNWCHYQNPVTSSYLAYVPNQFTANFLASYARSAFGTDDGNFWIGLSRKTSSSPWMWDNGLSLGFSNFGGQLGNNFAAESIVNAKWNTFGSADTNFFVCSYDPQAPPTFAPQSTNIPMSTIPVSTPEAPTTTGNISLLVICILER